MENQQLRNLLIGLTIGQAAKLFLDMLRKSRKNPTLFSAPNKQDGIEEQIEGE